jgi:hypothetical protein
MIGASTESCPFEASRATAQAVTGLEIEPTLKRVSG